VQFPGLAFESGNRRRLCFYLGQLKQPLNIRLKCTGNLFSNFGPGATRSINDPAEMGFVNANPSGQNVLNVRLFYTSSVSGSGRDYVPLLASCESFTRFTAKVVLAMCSNYTEWKLIATALW
jgi:hypothetical protein